MYLLMILIFTVNLDELQNGVNKELKKVKVWLDINKLSLNIDKTNFIILRSPQRPSSDIVNIQIGNLPVKRTYDVKFSWKSSGLESVMEISFNRTF